MATRLRDSISTAENVLPTAGQDALAEVIDAFTANFRRDADADFTPDELAEIERIAAEPFRPADSAAVTAFFTHDKP